MKITVQQFADSFFPTLIRQLTDETGIALREAKRIGEAVINKLKARFAIDKPHPVQVFQKAITIIVVRETNKHQRLIEKNFGLSEEGFHEMVAMLRSGDEQLYEKVFLSHFRPCLALLRKKYKATHQDAYDATMNAMLLFCRKLKTESIAYGNLRYLFTQMATHSYLKWIQREGKTEEFTQFDRIEQLPRFDQESYALLGKAFDKLGEKCRELLHAFYYAEQTLQQVAQQSDSSYAAIRKRKQRCTEKLREFFIKLS